MDIIEGLDLTGDLPEGFDYSLDDILEEYKTPSVNSRPAPETPIFPTEPVRMETDKQDISAAQVSVPSETAKGDPFQLGDILEEFSSKPEPVVRQTEPKGSVYEDDEGVKVYTPAFAGRQQTPPPVSPLNEGENDAPTVSFKAVAGLLNKKKKHTKKTGQAQPPVRSAQPEEPKAESDVDAVFRTEFTDSDAGDALYAGFGESAEKDTGMEPGHDFMADFGLSDSSDADAPADEDDARSMKRPSFSKAAAPIFSAFHAAKEKSGKAKVEQEEDLGPEVDPKSAARHYGSRVELYRSRLRIGAVLSVILAWLSFGFPVAGSLKNPAVCAAMCLILMLTVTLLGVDIFTAGFLAMLRKKPDAQSLLTVSCIAAAVDALVIILTHGSQGYLPFCAVPAVSMCFAIYSSMLYCRGQRFNLRVLDQMRNPTSITVQKNLVNEGMCVTRTPGYPDEFIHSSEEEDVSEVAYSAAAPFLLLAIPVLSLLAALLSKNIASFFHILSALYAAAASFSALLSFPLPYFLVSQELSRAGSAIAGWTGIRELGTADSVLVTDQDLFPAETVSIESVRILEGVDPETAVSYVASVISASGSCLAPVFTELVRKNNCILRKVEEFKCHEAGGLTAMIDGSEVLVGSSSFIKLMGIHLPQKLSSKNSVFLAINSKLVGIITVTYKPIVPVQRGLAALLQNKAEVIFAARDFNVTPLLIAQKFKLPSDSLNFPTFAERFRITDSQNLEESLPVAVVKRKSLFPFANVVTRARKLYSTICLSTVFSMISTLAGVILMFFLCCTGSFASASAGNLLLFMLLWLVPVVIVSVYMTK